MWSVNFVLAYRVTRMKMTNCKIPYFWTPWTREALNNEKACLIANTFWLFLKLEMLLRITLYVTFKSKHLKQTDNAYFRALTWLQSYFWSQFPIEFWVARKKSYCCSSPMFSKNCCDEFQIHPLHFYPLASLPYLKDLLQENANSMKINKQKGFGVSWISGELSKHPLLTWPS